MLAFRVLALPASLPERRLIPPCWSHPVKLHSLFALPLLAVPALAQYTGEPATLVNAAAPYNKLGATALGCTEVAQIRLIPHASLPAGTYYCAATIHKASVTRWILQSGTFNVATGVYTVNTDIDAAVAATTGDLFALGISNDLKVAVFDTSSGVKFATRAGTTGSFGAPTAVTGVTGTYLDPNFGQVNGSLMLLVAQGANKNISIGSFNATTGAVTGLKIVSTGGFVHSPTPVSNTAGETLGVLYFDAGASPYKALYSSLLEADINLPAKPFYTNTNWIANADATGGTLTIATATSTYTDPTQLGISAVASLFASATTPGPIALTSFAPIQSAVATPYVGVTLIGLLAAGPISIGGIVVGNLSLSNPVLLPVGAYDNASGTWVQKLPAPALPVGTKIYFQSAVCDLKANKVFLSNTGKIEWK